MIYSAFGAPVTIVNAERRTVPSPIQGREDIPDVWFVQAKLAGKFPDGTGEVGRPICDGAWVQACRFVADKGWGEIEDACKRCEGSYYHEPPFAPDNATV